MPKKKYWKSQSVQMELIKKIKLKRNMVERRSLMAEATERLIEDMTGVEYKPTNDQKIELEQKVEGEVTESQMYIELGGLTAKVEIADLSFGQRGIEAQKDIEDQEGLEEK